MQDAGGGSGSGDVQSAVSSALYSPYEKDTGLPEAFAVAHGCQEVCKFAEQRRCGCCDCEIVHADWHECGCSGGDFAHQTCVCL